MKAFIKKTTTALSIPDNFSSLESEALGAFSYRIRYMADPSECAKLKAFTVKIHISKTPYVKKINPLFGDVRPLTVIDRLRSMLAAQKDVTRSSTSEYLMTYISDLTTRISNSKANKLSKSKSGVVNRAKKIVAKPVEELTSQNINAPVLDANLASGIPTASEQSAKIDALSMLFNSGIDPAKSSNTKTNTIRTAQSAFDGTITKRNTQGDNGRFGQSLASGLLNKTDFTSLIELDRSDFLGILEEVQETFIEVIEDLSIPNSALNDGDFYVIFELINDKGFPIQVSSNLVTHNQNLRLLRVPTKPPKVSARPVNRPGKVSFDIVQDDPNARGISVYKKTISPNQNAINGEYSFVGRTDLRIGQPAQRFEDQDAGLNYLSYRFIPYFDEASTGAVFATSIVKFARESMAKRQNFLQRQNFVSITGDIRDFGISITLKDLPYNAVAVTLKKRNLTTKQSVYQVVGGGAMLLDMKGNASLFVDDTDVSSGRVYEYSAFILFKDGCEVAGSNTLVIEYEPIVANIANTIVGEPQLISLANGYDATFTIQLSELNNKSELVKKLISSQGLQAEFQGDISAAKEKLNRLFAFAVSRDNLTTGEHENFGIIDSNMFSDRKYGIAKNVKPLDPGAEYKYTVTTYFRNPETLFTDLTRNVATGNTSYELQPSKWLHPLTLRDGNVVSEASLKRNHAKSEFAQGSVADIQTVNLSLANIMPEIEDARVTRIREKANLLQWKINGAASKIDHFIVALEILGMRTIVGAAHNITNSNYFEFVDVLEHGEKGALTYIIVPIYYDYSKGTESKTNSIII